MSPRTVHEGDVGATKGIEAGVRRGLASADDHVKATRLTFRVRDSSQAPLYAIPHHGTAYDFSDNKPESTDIVTG